MAAYVDLQPGTRIKVSPPGDPLGVSYEATVRAALPSSLRLGLPRRDEEVLDVTPGDSLTMFTTLHGRVFRFKAAVRLVEVENDSFFIDTPREAEQTERREYYRLVTRIVPRLAVRLDDAGLEVQPIQSVILDISGGGAMLQTREYVAAGNRLRLVFELDGDPFDMDIAALVLSCNRPSPNAQHYRLHVQFLEPNRSEVERLIRYVYRQQSEMRRKGVILVLILRVGLYVSVGLAILATWLSLSVGYAIEVAMLRGLIAFMAGGVVSYLGELVVMTAPPVAPRRQHVDVRADDEGDDEAEEPVNLPAVRNEREAAGDQSRAA